MRLLLDTHVALWAVTQSAALPAAASALILDPSNVLFVSVITVWEIAIKHWLQRGRPNDMPINGAQALEYFEAAGFAMLPVSAAHASSVDGLPLHHADPFDRMIVAQALLEPLRLVTSDRQLRAYGDTVIAV